MDWLCHAIFIPIWRFQFTAFPYSYTVLNITTDRCRKKSICPLKNWDARVEFWQPKARSQKTVAKNVAFCIRKPCIKPQIFQEAENVHDLTCFFWLLKAFLATAASWQVKSSQMRLASCNSAKVCTPLRKPLKKPFFRQLGLETRTPSSAL